MTFLSDYDYLTNLMTKIRLKNQDAKFKPNQCVYCCDNISEKIFIPCGHETFCRDCIKNYKQMSCPFCKEECTLHNLSII